MATSLARSISGAMRGVVASIQTLARGDVSCEIVPSNRRNEIGDVERALQGMARAARANSDAAMALARGKLATDIAVLSDDDTPGLAQR